VYLPVEQLEQPEAREEAPAVVPNVPVAQEVHVAVPVLVVYLPAAQLEHAVAPAAEKAPAPQLAQSAAEAAPAEA